MKPEELEYKKESFLNYLETEFLRIRKKNQNYSLRSYAKMLDISPGALSALLNRSRPLTSKMMDKLGHQLGLKPIQWQEFQLSDKEYDFLEKKLDSQISSWKFDAILELLQVQDFESNPKYVGKKLGLNVVEATTLIKLLQKLNLIKTDKNNRWIDNTTGNYTNALPCETNESRRQHQKELLLKSIESLDECPVTLRDHSSMTLAIHTQDLPKAREIIKKFRREFDKELGKRNSKDSVYQLTVSFFPLTKIETKKD
jgi:plasmid maintenance system antidote protein VapI